MKDIKLMQHRPTDKINKVCYVVNSFPEISETFIVEEAKSLTEFGVDYCILSLKKGNFDLIHPAAKNLIDDNKVIFIDFSSKFSLFISLIKLATKKGPISVVNSLLKALRNTHRWSYFLALPIATKLLDEKIDYIHAHFADRNLLITAALSEWTAIPFGFTTHRYDIIDTAPLSINTLEKIANNAKCIVTVSQFNKRLMVNKYGLQPKQIYVAYNGIQAEFFNKTNNQIPKIKKPLQLLNIGRLVPVKGQDILIEAVYRVREMGYKIDLKIIGDGPQRKSLESLSQQLKLHDCIKFMGAQPQKIVHQALNNTDVFVMPSRSEGFAVACLEAMAMELPVIASNITGFPEAISDYESGILFELENNKQLADAIIWMIEHPVQREEMGKNGRKIVLNNFTRKKVTEGLLNYWNQTI